MKVHVGWAIAVGLGALLLGAGLSEVLPKTKQAEAVSFVPGATGPIRETYGGSGTFRVPEQVAPGTYMVTAGAGDFGCHWERLKAYDGKEASILSTGNASRGAYGRLVVNPKDKGVRMVGDCVWVRL